MFCYYPLTLWPKGSNFPFQCALLECTVKYTYSVFFLGKYGQYTQYGQCFVMFAVYINNCNFQ